MQVGGSFGTAVLAVILATGATGTTAAFHVAFAWDRRLGPSDRPHWHSSPPCSWPTAQRG